MCSQILTVIKLMLEKETTECLLDKYWKWDGGGVFKMNKNHVILFGLNWKLILYMKTWKP